MNTTSRNENQAKVAPLVGKKYLIDCYIQGERGQALWDSGSQVTIMDELWKDVHLPNARLRDITEILDTADTLDIVAANGENKPYGGWVETTFSLASREAPNTEVIVPTLVMKGNKLVQPIIGSNVIELLIGGEVEQPSAMDREQLGRTVRAVFPDLAADQVQAFIEQVSAEQMSEYVVKTRKERVNIPKHMSVQIECHAHMYHPHLDATLIFEPDVHGAEGLEFCETLIKVTKGIKPTITVSVQNPTDHDIVLAGGTVIGNLQHIQAVYPASVLDGSRFPPPATMNHITVEKDQATDNVWDPPVNLSHLSQQERDRSQNVERRVSLLFTNR